MSPAAEDGPAPDRHHRPTPGGADSAGQPWAGRRFQQNASSGDDGSAPERLIESLRRFRAGEVGEAEVVDAFRDSRLLIPLVAHLGEAGSNEQGQLVDKSQELSIVTVTGPDGRTVLPVFSSVGAMSAWNGTARPIPADGVRVALAAASEQTDVVVLDPTSTTEFAIRRPALWAIAQSQPWTPSFSDAAVRQAFERSIEPELAVVTVRLRAGDPDAKLAGSELVVELGLLQGLTQQELDAVLARLAQRWAADETIATRVDSLAVSLRPAD
ncbi:SseB family protein [Plantibacter sp. ME-Dv--P-095]|uniref:SseB family protein n=1 Tax=Plantibacter sp. ME-Dv--P-095 TaxID=3040299 RepID=UPI00254EEC69|nr:SseB family protein [Plantibacter sp. ME-Dv--P-095]